MKPFIILLCMAITAALLTPCFGENTFAPWGHDVRTGDETAAPGTCRDRHTPSMGSSVFDAPRGGAYLMIRFFQVVISPQDGPSCRFSPVCSTYGRKSVERFGALLGGALAGDRILRCNPFNPPGKNPVPETVFGK